MNNRQRDNHQQFSGLQVHADSYYSNTPIKTLWVSTYPIATPVASSVKFKYTITKTDDEVSYQYYYAEIPDGNTTDFEQSFTFLSTQIRKDVDVEEEFFYSDFENVSYYANPDDVSQCRECDDSKTVAGLDKVQANYSWSSVDCYPGMFILDTSINY